MDAEALRKIIVDTGARQRTEERIAALTAEALAALDAAPLVEEAKLVLTELAEAATQRTR